MLYADMIHILKARVQFKILKMSSCKSAAVNTDICVQKNTHVVCNAPH